MYDIFLLLILSHRFSFLCIFYHQYLNADLTNLEKASVFELVSCNLMWIKLLSIVFELNNLLAIVCSLYHATII